MAALDKYNWDGLADDLEGAMLDVYPDILRLAYLEQGKKLPVAVAFDLRNPRVRDTIKQLGGRIRGVSDTMRDNVQRIVGHGTDTGQSIAEIAKGLREYGVTDSRSRSEMLARTESATAYNRGATLAYRDAGIERVRVMDGDEDEACAAADGQIWTVDEAEENPIAHPNCTRAFIPVVGED
jgi:SPP1 gp7 family putative phage head morphogenesis protein